MMARCQNLLTQERKVDLWPALGGLTLKSLYLWIITVIIADFRESLFSSFKLYINMMHYGVLFQAHEGVEYRSFPDISHLISSYVDVGVNNGLCCALVSPVSPGNCHPVTHDDDDDDSSTYLLDSIFGNVYL